MAFASEDIAAFYAEETFDPHRDSVEEAWFAFARQTNTYRCKKYAAKMRLLARLGDPRGRAFLDKKNARERKRRRQMAPNRIVRRGPKTLLPLPERIGMWRVLSETRLQVAKGNRQTTRAVVMRCEALPGCETVVTRPLNQAKGKANGCHACRWKKHLLSVSNHPTGNK